MKKFLKLGAVFAAVLLAIVCIASCDVEKVEGMASVTLTGSSNGYYLYGYSAGYLSRGYLSSSGSVYEDKDGCAASFNTTAGRLSISIMQDKSIYTPLSLTVYDGSRYQVGTARLTKVDGRYKLSYSEY